MLKVESRRTLDGLYIQHNKRNKEDATLSMPIPAQVRIPMLQHMGKACNSLVKKGDQVKVGQKIGDSDAYMSVPIHASVSGTVAAIENYTVFGGQITQSVVIEADGEQTLDHPDAPVDAPNRKAFIAAIRESGLCGLGGAGFPTHVKLDYKDVDRIDTLVINAAECEPYITSDYREMLENPDQILEGIRLVMKYLSIQNAFIGIEDNKPAAIELFMQKTADASEINITTLRSKYPQGAEKVITYAATGRIIEEGKLPADHGVLVMNVSTVSFIAEYMRTSQPLTSRRITVSGDAVETAKNIFVPVGTAVADVLDYCGGISEDVYSILMGGPMMGVAVAEMEAPVVKNNNALTVMRSTQKKLYRTTACIRCGKCVKVCPVNLMPAMLERAFDNENFAVMPDLGVNVCIGCGCCSYVCPAKRNLAQKIQLAKPHVRKYLEGLKNKEEEESN